MDESARREDDNDGRRRDASGREKNDARERRERLERLERLEASPNRENDSSALTRREREQRWPIG
jgi:hypothetical protein